MTRRARAIGGAVALAGLALAAAGAPSWGQGPRPAAASRVSAGGVTLTSAAIELPVDEGGFPAGANADLVTADCTACHSATMATSQPPLSADQWQAEVTKMREAYRAPVPPEDDAAIVAYLAAMPGQRPVAPLQRRTM